MLNKSYVFDLNFYFILMEYLSVWGYFIPKGYEIAYLVISG